MWKKRDLKIGYGPVAIIAGIVLAFNPEVAMSSKSLVVILGMAFSIGGLLQLNTKKI